MQTFPKMYLSSRSASSAHTMLGGKPHTIAEMIEFFNAIKSSLGIGPGFVRLDHWPDEEHVRQYSK